MVYPTMAQYVKFLLASMFRAPPEVDGPDSSLARNDSCLLNDASRQRHAGADASPEHGLPVTENTRAGPQRAIMRSNKPQTLSAIPSFQATKSKWSPPPSPGSQSPRMASLPMTRSDSASSTTSGSDLSSTLYMAACAGDFVGMQIALSQGASIDSSVLVPGVFEAFKPAKPGRLSALAGAASYGQMAAVRFLVANGAEVNPCSQRCASSPLHQAIRRNDIAIVRFLLDNGADVNIHNAYKVSPTMYACKYSGPDLLSLLLQYTPELKERSFIGGSAIHWSIWPGRSEMTELLLRAGADPCEPMPNGNAPLHCAIVAGSSGKMVKTLLKYGADPLQRNEASETPWSLAQTQCGHHSQIVAMLRTVISMHAHRRP